MRSCSAMYAMFLVMLGLRECFFHGHQPLGGLSGPAKALRQPREQRPVTLSKPSLAEFVSGSTKKS